MDTILASKVASATSTLSGNGHGEANPLLPVGPTAADLFVAAMMPKYPDGTIGAVLLARRNGGDGQGQGARPVAEKIVAEPRPPKKPSLVEELRELQKELRRLQNRLGMDPPAAVAEALQARITESEEQIGALRLQLKGRKKAMASAAKLVAEGSDGKGPRHSRRRSRGKGRARRDGEKTWSPAVGAALEEPPSPTKEAPLAQTAPTAKPAPIAAVTALVAAKPLCWLCRRTGATATLTTGEVVCRACAKSKPADRITVACVECEGTINLAKEVVLAARRKEIPVRCRACWEKAKPATAPVVGESAPQADHAKPKVPCFVCGKRAFPGPRLTWKSPENPVCDELSALVTADPYGRVCKKCLLLVLHISNLPTEQQPKTLEALQVYVARNKEEMAKRKAAAPTDAAPA